MLDLQSLRNEGVVNVPYPSRLRKGVLDAVVTWQTFTQLADEIKSCFEYEQDARVSGVGYEGPRTSGEQKENFHIRLTQRSRLQEQARRACSQEASNLLEATFDLVALKRPFVKDVGEALESTFKILGLQGKLLAAANNALFRFLHYLPGSAAGTVIAEPHCDKGNMTAHLYESTSGLEYLSRDGRLWKSMEIPEGETAIIAAMGLQQKSRCNLWAACHRVIANEETCAHGRISAVCFLDVEDPRHWDKKRVGRTQDYPAGFFYHMPFGRFNKYFTG